MKKVLLASFDLEIGGVERSLINLLRHFDYEKNAVDLMLYRHAGELITHVPQEVNVLRENEAYRTFRLSIRETFQAMQFQLAFARLLAKGRVYFNRSAENGYKQMQYMWKYALRLLPKLEGHYDVAISYLWPHYFVLEKVSAKKKIAWIHTDYSTVDIDEVLDEKMWEQFDVLVAVSEACKQAFLTKYPNLAQKIIVIENIQSPDVIQALADEPIPRTIQHDLRFKIVTVARLSHAKGIDKAVSALHLLKEKGYDNLVWYVIGYGGDETKIRKLITTYQLNDSFQLLGKKTNPYPYMKHADLYVQPSRYEGKAVTVLEAQILGKPVLITDYPTSSSQVRNGIDGFICARSPEGIATGIEKLYHDSLLRKELALTCMKTNFHNESELQKLYNVM